MKIFHLKKSFRENEVDNRDILEIYPSKKVDYKPNTNTK